MAINDTQNGNVAPASDKSTMANAFDQAASGQNGGGRRAGSFSFVDMGSLARAPMGRNPQGEILSKLAKALTEAYDAAIGKDTIVTVLPIDRNNQIKLTFSLLVVVVQQAARRDVGSFHTLILEGSADPLAPRFENLQGQNIEIMKVASDAYDGVLMDVVSTELNRQFPKVTLLNAGCCVVPRSFNVEDKTIVHQLASNTVIADFTELTVKTPGFADLNLANAEKDSSLQVRPTFSREEVYDATGLPIRSDAKVDLLAVQQVRGPEAQSVNTGLDRQSMVSTCSGFLDLIYDPVVPQNVMYMMPNQLQPTTQKYQPRFIITNLDSIRLLTLPAQLLGLVSAVLLREDMSWAGAFRPKALTGKDVDMHDIGGVGIEANLENNPQGVGTRINTRTDSFRPEDLGRLIALTMKSGLALSMDIPECGAQSWYNEVFAAAAGGSEKAYKTIIDAANTLTNGNFARHFASNDRIFMDLVERVHLGYYTDRAGVKRDIRDIDYLAVANLVGEKDPGMIREWSDTFLRTQYPLHQRLARRKQIINGLLPDAEFTGFARRVTFDGKFIDALVLACRDCQLSIRNTGGYMDAGTIDRPTGSFFAQAVMGSQATGLFNRDMGYFGSQNVQQGGNFMRW